jgi:hypothetical protein
VLGKAERFPALLSKLTKFPVTEQMRLRLRSPESRQTRFTAHRHPLDSPRSRDSVLADIAERLQISLSSLDVEVELGYEVAARSRGSISGPERGDARQLRHSSSNARDNTLRIYSHWFNAQDSRAVDGLAA